MKPPGVAIAPLPHLVIVKRGDLVEMSSIVCLTQL